MQFITGTSGLIKINHISTHLFRDKKSNGAITLFTKELDPLLCREKGSEVKTDV